VSPTCTTASSAEVGTGPRRSRPVVTGAVDRLQERLAQALEGAALGLDQEPQRLGAVDGQPEEGALAAGLERQVGADRLLGLAEQTEEQVLGADLLVAVDGRVGGEACGPARRRGPPAG
jgi:hypothetical protein